MLVIHSGIQETPPLVTVRISYNNLLLAITTIEDGGIRNVVVALKSVTLC